MLNTVLAVVREGKIELLEKADMPEGARVLVTVLSGNEESLFWTQTSQAALDVVWDNADDDVYAQCL